jgi:1,4-dihydroxy-2-naphthoate polyprenyltransferase
VLWMSLFMLFCGYTYTGGPFPLAYYALGEVATFFCFGLMPVAVTYYVQAQHMDDSVLLLSLAPSLLSAAILCVNNLRDVGTDAKAGKTTSVVLVGPRAGRALYVLFVAGSVLVPVVLWVGHWFGPTLLLSLLALPLLREPLRRVLRETGPSLNAALGATAKFEGVFGLLLALGVLLDP